MGGRWEEGRVAVGGRLLRKGTHNLNLRRGGEERYMRKKFVENCA